jgi:hypothetical protein
MTSRLEVMTSRSRRLVPWLLFLATLLSALPLGAMIAASAPPVPGECEGIGFGCSLHGWNAAEFALLILGLPYAMVLFVLLAVLSSGDPRSLPAQTFVAVAGLVIPWVFVVWSVAAVR